MSAAPAPLPTIRPWAQPWGTVRCLCGERSGSASFAAIHVTLLPGHGHELHAHPGSDELFHIVSGRGEMTIEEIPGDPRRFPLRVGDSLFVRAGVPHGAVAIGGPLELLAVYGPSGPEELLRPAGAPA